MRLVQSSRWLLSGAVAFVGFGPSVGGAAATLAPPLLDISKMCEVASGRNAAAMSECVVAESIARSDLLRMWDKLADADVQVCLKASRKAKHRPYGALSKCLSVAAVDAPKVAPMAAHATKP